MSRAELFEQAKNLPLHERIELVNQLWNSIADEEGETDLTPEQLNEVERRATEIREHPDLGVPWKEAKARLKIRFGWR